MNKICTDISQSQKLLELGIDVKTADICWSLFTLITNGNKEIKQVLLPISYEEVTKQPAPDFIERYPAWSLTALLELMPPYLFEFERGIDLNIYRNLNGKGWHCSYMPNVIENMKKDKFRQITNGDNPVDASFEMVVWLKENNKI